MENEKPPALYTGLSFEEYRAIRAVNQSSIIRGERSPLHLRHALESPDHRVSDALDIGKAVHAAVLEPDTFRVYPPPINERTGNPYGRDTKAWSEYVAGLPAGSIVLDQDEIARVHAARDALLSHPVAGPLLRRDSAREVCAVWVDKPSGVLCKGRIDLLTHDLLIDLKTTDDASPRGLSRSIRRWSYHLQAAFYVDGFSALASATYDYVTVWVESDAPHAVSVSVMPPALIAAGRDRYRRVLDAYAEASSRGVWTPYPEIIYPNVEDVE